MNKKEIARQMLEMSKDSLLMFEVGAITRIQQEMKENFGKKAEDTLYSICYEKEKEIISRAIPLVPIKSSTQISEVDRIMSLVDLFGVFTEEANFGEMFDVRVDVKNKRMELKVKGNPVAQATVDIYEKFEEPQCTLQRGIIGGLGAAVFKAEMECKETKCVCCGDDYCEFKVRKKQ